MKQTKTLIQILISKSKRKVSFNLVYFVYFVYFYGRFRLLYFDHLGEEIGISLDPLATLEPPAFEKMWKSMQVAYVCEVERLSENNLISRFNIIFHSFKQRIYYYHMIYYRKKYSLNLINNLF